MLTAIEYFPCVTHEVTDRGCVPVDEGSRVGLNMVYDLRIFNEAYLVRFFSRQYICAWSQNLASSLEPYSKSRVYGQTWRIFQNVQLSSTATLLSLEILAGILVAMFLAISSSSLPWTRYPIRRASVKIMRQRDKKFPFANVHCETPAGTWTPT